MTKKLQVYHFECPPNFKKLLYDDAVNELKDTCHEVDTEIVNSLKYHINTWGLSSNNWFAENVVVNMAHLNRIDFSDTVKYRHRSDLCMGAKSILASAIDKNIIELDMSSNFLDVDGARAFSDFLA